MLEAKSESEAGVDMVEAGAPRGRGWSFADIYRVLEERGSEGDVHLFGDSYGGCLVGRPARES